MPHPLNALGQPVGFPLPGWTPRPRPPRAPLAGRYCRLEPLDPDRHAATLHARNLEDTTGASWTYLPYGPFVTEGEHRSWVEESSRSLDPLFFAICDPDSGSALGVASYLRIAPEAGSIEIGHIHFSPGLQRSRAATESMYLLIRQAFELGYRRLEWKCDALNAPSRRAAQRLGLSYEGTFRQATVTRGRNRDTAWYAAIDSEWLELRRAFEEWLGSQNFDADGKQLRSLSAMTAPILKTRG